MIKNQNTDGEWKAIPLEFSGQQVAMIKNNLRTKALVKALWLPEN